MAKELKINQARTLGCRLVFLVFFIAERLAYRFRATALRIRVITFRHYIHYMPIRKEQGLILYTKVVRTVKPSENLGPLKQKHRKKALGNFRTSIGERETCGGEHEYEFEYSMYA